MDRIGILLNNPWFGTDLECVSLHMFHFKKKKTTPVTLLNLQAIMKIRIALLNAKQLDACEH